jgi:protein-disulfide isomerase
MYRFSRWVAVAALVLTAAACAPSAPPEVPLHLPGAGFAELTPREKTEVLALLRELTSPCRDVAVPIDQCVREARPCGRCILAAHAVIKSVRDGMGHAQAVEAYKKRFDPSAVLPIPADDSPTLGPPAAKVTIVEFADFQCPFCAKTVALIDKVIAANPNDVKFVFKHMPLAMHARGEPSARAAWAAGKQGKFWEMHHLLFQNPHTAQDGDFEKFATDLGLDVKAFLSDYESPAAKERIGKDVALANELGVRATPAVFVNGREFAFEDDLQTWVDRELK